MKFLKEEISFLFWNMKEENYKLFLLCNEDDEVVSFVGVVICMNFYNKKYVFVYDFVIVEVYCLKRYGKVLFLYIENWGKENECEFIVFMLVFLRIDVYCFYEREGYDKVSYFFYKEL